MSLGLSRPKESLALQTTKAICTTIVFAVFAGFAWGVSLILPDAPATILIGAGIVLALVAHVFLLATPIGKYLCFWPFYFVFPY